MNEYNEKGFTLVELMIVFVIIGIMAVMAMPSLDLIFSKDKLKASTSSVTSSIYLARMKAVNDGESYGVKFNSNGVFFLVRDPAGAYEIRGAPSRLEDGVQFLHNDFTNDLIIFNEFGQLEKTCLPSGQLTGRIVLWNGLVDSTSVSVTYLTGRIREKNL